VILFALVALVALGWFVASAPPGWPTAVAAGLILGGALGNLVDRLTRGDVVDFVSLPAWPAFNLADVSITVGVVALAVIVIRAGDQ
ncbi:MAG: signal peptidase II, partial [Solirubrobacterales bacterium]